MAKLEGGQEGKGAEVGPGGGGGEGGEGEGEGGGGEAEEAGKCGKTGGLQ